MAGSSNGEEADYWPGYVDALTAMVKVLSFVMMLLSVAVFVLSQNVSKKLIETIAEAAKVDTKSGGSLDQITKQIAEKINSQQAEMKELQQKDEKRSEDQQKADVQKKDISPGDSKSEAQAKAELKAQEEKTKAAENKALAAESKAQAAESKAQALEQKAQAAPQDQTIAELKQAKSQAEALTKEALQAKAEAKEAQTKAEALSKTEAQTKAEAQSKLETQAKEIQDSKKQVLEQQQQIEQQKQQIEAVEKQLAQVKEMAAPGQVPGGNVVNPVAPAQQVVAIAQDQLVKNEIKTESANDNSEFVITFLERQSSLDDAALKEITKFAKTEKGIGEAKSIELRGYADASLGSITDSRRVAFYRVMTVRQILINSGIAANKLNIKVVDVMSVDEGRKVKIAGQR